MRKLTIEIEIIEDKIITKGTSEGFNTLEVMGLKDIIHEAYENILDEIESKLEE